MKFDVCRGARGVLAAAFLLLPAQAQQIAMPDGDADIAAIVRALQNRDLDRAESLLQEADRTHDASAFLLNCRGVIALERGRYDQAESLFRDALALDPKFYPAKFNLAETALKRGDRNTARKGFGQLLADNPKDELAAFKLVISHLINGDMEQARSALDAIPWPSDTPAYYFAHAAFAYVNGNAKDGIDWINSSLRIFPPRANLMFARSLEELGWIARSPVSPAAVANAQQRTPTSAEQPRQSPQTSP